MKLHISVTNKHIATGKRHNSCSCPVALAIKDVLAECKSYVVVVENEIIMLVKAFDHNIQYPLTDEAKHWICEFDLFGSVKPFSFDVEIAAEDLVLFKTKYFISS